MATAWVAASRPYTSFWLPSASNAGQPKRVSVRGEKFKNARPEELQRIVMMTAIQFGLFEPDDWVTGSGDFKKAAENLLEVTISQLNWLREQYHKPKDGKK